MDIYLARQPIYDRELNVFAYELLYRSGDRNAAGTIDDPDEASSKVILNAFVDLDIDQLAGGRPVFINVTRNFLFTDSVPFNFGDRMVLEILESEVPDEAFIEKLKQMRRQGFRFALDDFEYNERWKPLVPLADAIKYDVLALGEAGTRAQLEILKSLHDVNVKLIAEKVETSEEYETYRDLGFDYFQGYFLARPKLIKNKGVPASKGVVLTLLSKLNNSGASFDEIEKLISQDVRLTYKILKVVNSALMGLPRKVDSIERAVVILGLDEIRCWATLMSLSLDDNKPHELLVAAMVRGQMCKLLGRVLKVDDPGTYFTMGLFSLMDAIMSIPLETIVDSMPFSDEMKNALRFREGKMGELLDTVVCYEKADFDHVSEQSLCAEVLSNAYFDSLEWASAALKSMFSENYSKKRA